jgi:hypothetical protein
MNRAAYMLALLGLLSLFVGCKKQASDADGIRKGINQHLASLKTINLDAMDMNITKVSVQGNQAQAQVEFRPKTGSPSGGGMQIAYTLEKQNGAWVVQSTQAVGVSTQYPGAADPQMNGSSPSSDSLPNFRDLVPGSGDSRSLPPGHPPINGQGTTQQ